VAAGPDDAGELIPNLKEADMSYLISRRRFGIAAGAGALALSASPFEPAFAQDAKIAIKYGNAGNDQTLSNRFNAKLAKLVEERSGGTITTQIFAGTLGGEQRLIEGMSLGTLDVYNGAYTGTREYDIFYSPYFFKDAEHAKRVLKGTIGAKASKVIEDRYNASYIGVGRLGPYVLSTKRKISSLAEVKGMKLRTPQIEGCIEAVKHLGAAPTPIPFTDIYLALQNGTVDGFVSALNPSVAGKFYEVCKFVMENPFGEALDKQLIATRTVKRMSERQRKLYMEAFDELEAPDYYGASLTAIKSDFETWRKFNGADSVVALDQEEIKKTMEPLNRRLAESVYGAGAWETIQGA
jgi:TRAP-type C4-dicarboxylate transport system substrate-binding protein